MKNILARGGIEFIAVLMGISLSLFLDNQSEESSKKQNEINLLKDLRVSLLQDLDYARGIQQGIKKCTNSQKILMELNCIESKKIDEKELGELIYFAGRGINSFFPRYGVYRSLVSNSEMKYIKSDSLKEKIINLYDFRFKRYENMDIVMENLYQYDFNLFLVENFSVNVLDSLDYVVENYEFDSSSFCDGSLNKKIKYINGITVAIENALENIIESMVTVDSMIKEEIIL
tara:strand:- start:55 stop:747 length:693 start_codon:yes stop_codon:yes gene_type:complete